MSNIVSFVGYPFVQDLPILLKVLYSIGLFVVVLIITVIVIRILQALFKPHAELGLSQSIAGSPAGGDIYQAGGDINVTLSSQHHNAQKRQNELDHIKNECPKIETTIRQQHNDFDIEVLNKGEEAEFEAQIEVLDGKSFVPSLLQNYPAYWENTKNGKTKLKKGHKDWLKIASLQVTPARLMNFRLHYYHVFYFENSTISGIAYADSSSWIPGDTQVVRPCISLRITISSKPSMVDGAFARTYELSDMGLSEVSS